MVATIRENEDWSGNQGNVCEFHSWTIFRESGHHVDSRSTEQIRPLNVLY